MKPPPRVVRVGPFRLRLRVSRKAIDRVRAAAGDDRVGETNIDSLVIAVDPTLAPDALADTVLHEILHAVWRTAGLGESRASKHEESVVRAMAPLLLDTLRRNAGLFAWLADG